MVSPELRQQRLRRRGRVGDIVHVLLERGYRLENKNLSLEPPAEFPLRKFLLAIARADSEEELKLAHRDDTDVDLNPDWDLVAVWDLDTGKAVDPREV